MNNISDKELLERCSSFRAAVRLCFEMSGLGMKQLAAEIGMEVKTLSRCLSLNDDDRRYLPDDRLVPFMMVCGNALPLRWLSLQLGQPSGELLRQELENERLVRETERRSGLVIVMSGLEVVAVAGEVGRYHVSSARKIDQVYLVDLSELVSGWCGCEHFEYRSGLQLDPVIECKHIAAAREFERGAVCRSC